MKRRFSSEIGVFFAGRTAGSRQFARIRFDLAVDSVPYKFQDLTGKPVDLFSQVRKGKRVGFFNEEDTVKLSNIVIDKLA